MTIVTGKDDMKDEETEALDQKKTTPPSSHKQTTSKQTQSPKLNRKLDKSKTKINTIKPVEKDVSTQKINSTTSQDSNEKTKKRKSLANNKGDSTKKARRK